MKKTLLLLLVMIITGFVSNPGACPETSDAKGPTTEVETISVKPIKVATIRPFFRLEKTVEATAYTSCSGDLTFTQTKPGWGTVAVDPEKIPLGSVVFFPNDFPGQKFLALDTGKKIKGWKIDIWMPEGEMAIEWGKKKIKTVIKIPVAFATGCFFGKISPKNLFNGNNFIFYFSAGSIYFYFLVNCFAAKRLANR